jgi:hypothetical protein
MFRAFPVSMDQVSHLVLSLPRSKRGFEHANHRARVKWSLQKNDVGKTTESVRDPTPTRFRGSSVNHYSDGQLRPRWFAVGKLSPKPDKLIVDSLFSYE